MDNRRVVWDAANRKHLSQDHPERKISLDEIEQVLHDQSRIEVYQPEREAHQAIGRTNSGRWLVVAWLDQPHGRYPIHARVANDRLIRRLTK
jgi:uncharacterized DUF497 family protein